MIWATIIKLLSAGNAESISDLITSLSASMCSKEKRF